VDAEELSQAEQHELVSSTVARTPGRERATARRWRREPAGTASSAILGTTRSCPTATTRPSRSRGEAVAEEALSKTNPAPEGGRAVRRRRGSRSPTARVAPRWRCASPWREGRSRRAPPSGTVAMAPRSWQVDTRGGPRSGSRFIPRRSPPPRVARPGRGGRCRSPLRSAARTSAVWHGAGPGSPQARPGVAVNLCRKECYSIAHSSPAATRPGLATLA
jgi:hypothetical protein